MPIMQCDQNLRAEVLDWSVWAVQRLPSSYSLLRQGHGQHAVGGRLHHVTHVCDCNGDQET